MVAGAAGAQATGSAKCASGTALLACATLRTRMRSLADAAISRSASSVLDTGNSMFDWPEQSHTSPTSRSEIDRLSPDLVRSSREYGPPADIAGSMARQ